MISLSNISFAYPRSAPLFSDLSLHLTPGAIYGLLGKNGAGKTTLLKIAAGLLYPHSGTVSLLDYPASSRCAEMLNQIAFIAEDPWVPPVTPNLYVKMQQPLYPSFDTKLFHDYLQRFEIGTDRRLTALSFGQKKKFLLAFALASDTRVLILDEPTNGLDIPSKRQLRQILAESISPTRLVVISTHQVRDLEHLIEALVVLDTGRIVLSATMEQLSTHLQVKSCSDRATADAALYSEPALDGYVTIVPNTGSSPSNPDMELLFNAIVARGDTINRILTTGGPR